MYSYRLNNINQNINDIEYSINNVNNRNTINYITLNNQITNEAFLNGESQGITQHQISQALNNCSQNNNQENVILCFPLVYNQVVNND